MGYIKRKTAKAGTCKICERVGPLSWDHIPPQGGVTLEPVEIENVFQFLVGPDDQRKFEISQNGVKYRTICESCNNKLGLRYDPVLNEFAIGVGNYLKTQLHLPSIVKYRTKPVALIRAILGHLLAAQLDLNKSNFDQSVRTFVFDDSKPIPDDIHIFYWIYPYNQTVVIRDIAMPPTRGVIGGKDIGIFYGILKYFPIGYIVTDLDEYEGLDELTKFCTLRSVDEVELRINLRGIKDIDWPEVCDDNFVITTQGTESSVVAKPRRK